MTTEKDLEELALFFPRVLHNQHFETLEALESYLKRRGIAMVVEHPGQYSPADALRQSPPFDRRIMGLAAARLLADAEDPKLLTFLAEIGPWAYASWYEAVLKRLAQSPPLPVGGGYSSDGPAREVLYSLFQPESTREQQQRLRGLLLSTGWGEGLVYFDIRYGRASALALSIHNYVNGGSAAVDVVRHGLCHLALKDPGQLLFVAPSLSSFPKSVLAHYLKRLEQLVPEWMADHASRLHAHLGLEAKP